MTDDTSSQSSTHHYGKALKDNGYPERAALVLTLTEIAVCLHNLK